MGRGGALQASPPWCRRPAASFPAPAPWQEGKDIKTCAKEVKECDGLRNAYSACKRGQIDARSRLRGNKGY